MTGMRKSFGDRMSRATVERTLEPPSADDEQTKPDILVLSPERASALAQETDFRSADHKQKSPTKITSFGRLTNDQSIN